MYLIGMTRAQVVGLWLHVRRVSPDMRIRAAPAAAVLSYPELPAVLVEVH